MTYQQAFGAVAFALAIAAAALWAMRGLPAASAPTPEPLRYYVASMNGDEYHIQAHETRIEGFCTVFVRSGVRIAGVCGQHTWSEAVEAQ